MLHYVIVLVVCVVFQNITEEAIKTLNERLNLTETEAEEISHRMLPLGVPHVDIENASICLLTQTNYIAAYSHTHRMPLWTSFILSNQVTNIGIMCEPF